MSLKPPKRSDVNKAWMKAKPDRNKIFQPEYHLIVTEGTNTEPYYFNAIKHEINGKYRNKIQLVIQGEGRNTITLFQKALKLVENSGNVYKHVWVVYDTDDFPAERVDEVVSLCAGSSNSETKYHAIWSNQCIELWYLLHFEYLQSDIQRNQYFTKLTGQLVSLDKGEYFKNRIDMYQVLRPYLDVAVANAKRLNGVNGNKSPSLSAPGTKMYELIEKIRPYLGTYD